MLELAPQPWPRTVSTTGFELTLPSSLAAPGDARSRIDALDARLSPSAFADLCLVVSELVGNCVRHGSGEDIALAIEITDDGDIHGSVGDHGHAPVAIDDSRPMGEGGLGLRLVDMLASRWGVNAPTSDVWFELSPA